MSQVVDFELFIAEQYDRVLRIAVLLAGNREDAVEITRETFARALARWSRVSSMDAPTAWLNGVLVKQSRRRRRRRRRGRRRNPDSVALDITVSHTDAADSVRVTVHTALLELPEPQREALVLRYLADQSVAYTAQAMGCSTKTMRQHCARGLASLARALDVVEEQREAFRRD